MDIIDPKSRAGTRLIRNAAFMKPTTQGDEPLSERLPVAMYGTLTDRQHAIKLAHEWQLAHANDDDRDAYNVIVGLLGLLPYDELVAALAAIRAIEPSKERPNT